MAYSTIVKPEDYFNTKTYTGNGGTQTISGIGFQPDFTWVKGRDHAYYHYLQDAVRGSSNVLYTNNNDAEATGVTAGISAWNSDGYVTGSQGALNYNGRTFVAWNWKANGAGSANTDGNINSTVSANTTSGFSIVSYTGNGTAGATIGHGLGTAPKVVIVKRRSASGEWIMGHGSLGFTKFLELNLTGGAQTSTVRFNDTAPTNQVFTVGSTADTNQNGTTIIAYCFAEKQGFSKFGSYTGNGQADGTFVYTGFKPAFVMIKATSGTENWQMYDNKRLGYNVDNNMLRTNLPDAEQTDDDIDILSNGFKLRRNSGAFNTSGSTYIFMAFAEEPLVANSGTNGVPATAR